MALALQDQSQAGSDMTERVRLLLQGMEDDLERGVLPLTIYNNPEIHRLELRGIFARSWIFVAHESEIPSPGDYVQRYIGHDPWIVVRGEDGQVAATDVGLALEDPDLRARELLADVLECRVDDRPVEEDRARTDDGTEDGPALARGHVGAVSQRRWDEGKVRLDSRPCPDPWP